MLPLFSLGKFWEVTYRLEILTLTSLFNNFPIFEKYYVLIPGSILLLVNNYVPKLVVKKNDL